MADTNSAVAKFDQIRVERVLGQRPHQGEPRRIAGNENGGIALDASVELLPATAPEAFEQSLREARAFLDSERATQPIVTLYAWNEWAEGGYLEPDTTHGLAYLEAIRRVFPPSHGG